MTAPNIGLHAAEIARALLGEENAEHSTKAELRWGTNGSLAVRIAAPKRGTFYDHEAGEGGGMLDLIEREKGLKAKPAFDWLRSIGIEIDDEPKVQGKRRRVVATYSYQDRHGETVYRVLRWEPKSFSQQRWDATAGKFVGGQGAMEGVQRVPYRLKELLASDGPVLIVEGEKDVDRLAALGFVATCAPEGAGKWPKSFGPLYLADRDVVILPDNDQAGRDHARMVAESAEPVTERVRILELPDLPEKGDVSDWIAAGGTADQLSELIEAAPDAADVLATWKGDASEEDYLADYDSAVARLAQLKSADYDRVRKDEAKRLAVRAATLDADVAAAREATLSETEEATNGKGRPITFPEIEPWPERVDGAGLIDGMVQHVRRFVVMSESAAVAVALWTIHTWAHDAAFISPRLLALSPTKRCGKSSLMRWLASVVLRPQTTSNISASALFRVIEASKPTLLLDEMDAIGSQEKAEEIRQLVNCSHCRLDATVIRNVKIGEDYEPRQFSAWAPMALAYIRTVPDTIRDRSVIIPMQRKAPDASVEHVRRDRDQGFGELAAKVARWAADHIADLRGAEPALPDGLNDRTADNWRFLLAIADRAGGIWPERARRAAVELSLDVDDDDAIGIELLRDMKPIFDLSDRLSSDSIVSHLVALEGRPWCEFGRSGKPITKHVLARLLKPFKVSPGTVKLADGTTAKGYKRESFTDLWIRYIQTVTSSPANESAAFGDFQTVTPESEVTVTNPLNARESAAGDEVTFRQRGYSHDRAQTHASGHAAHRARSRETGIPRSAPVAANGAIQDEVGFRDLASGHQCNACPAEPSGRRSDERDSVPEAMKARLRELGWTENFIRSLKPAEAHNILRTGARPEHFKYGATT